MHSIKIGDKDYITSADAARIANLSRSRVSQLVKTGALEAVKLGSNVLVEMQSLNDYEQSDRKPGKKAKNEHE